MNGIKLACPSRKCHPGSFGAEVREHLQARTGAKRCVWSQRDSRGRQRGRRTGPGIGNGAGAGASLDKRTGDLASRAAAIAMVKTTNQWLADDLAVLVGQVDLAGHGRVAIGKTKGDMHVY